MGSGIMRITTRVLKSDIWFLHAACTRKENDCTQLCPENFDLTTLIPFFFALRPTLIPFFLSWKTLTSWQLCPQTNFDPIYFVLKNFDFMTTLISNQLWSHLFCPEKLWLLDNFALRPTLIPFILSPKTLTSWQLWSHLFCPQANFALKTLPSNKLCPQKFWSQANFDLKPTYSL